MKGMSNRDKMIIIIITIIIILVAGFFALIRPKYQALVKDTETFNATQEEWDGIEQKINAIPGLKSNITEIYNESTKIAKVFVNEAFADATKNYDDRKVNVAIDEHLQPAIDAAKLKIESLDIGNTGSEEIEYTYYTPNVVTYSLLEAADINGNYAEEIAEKIKADTVLSEKELAEVQVNTVKLEVVGEKDGLLDFLDQIKEDKNAVLVTAFEISDYQFLGGLDEEEETPQPTQPPVQAEPEYDEEGNLIETPTEAPAPVETPAQNNATEIEEGFSTMTIEVAFFNAKPIDQPDLGD
jgi:preprotein translocase subunit YajC